MVKNKKRYIGSFPTEVEAARAYDKATLVNHKRRVTTNFSYSLEEVEKIKEEQEHLFDP